MSATRSPSSISSYRGSFAALAVSFLLCAIFPATGWAAAPSLLWQTPESGVPGTGAGQFDHPGSVAVDPDSGHVFTIEETNGRISELDAWGQFVKAWGWGVANGAPEPQTCGPGAEPPTASCQAGIHGSGAGQFGTRPIGIDIDDSGNLYVAELTNFRVQKFDPSGKFLLMFGDEVDKGPIHPGDVCTAAFILEGDNCGAGIQGDGPGQISFATGDVLEIGPTGTIFLGGKGRIEEFNPDGSFKGEINLPPITCGDPFQCNKVEALDIDGDGNFYAVINRSPESMQLRKYDKNGNFLRAFDSEKSASQVALDSAGNIYLSVFGFSTQTGVVTYEVIAFEPSGNPIVPEESGFARSERHDNSEDWVFVGGLAANTVSPAGGIDVYVSGVNTNTISFLAAYGEPPLNWPPPQLAPEVRSQYTLSVDRDRAAVGAQINPRYWADTTYYVEWGTGRCSEGGCLNQQPVPPGALLGAGAVSVATKTKNVVLTGLQPGTTYHYRFVAQSSGGGPVHGVGVDEAEGTFITLPSAAAPNVNCSNQVFRSGLSSRLPDCRAYEMVSPVDKNNTDIVSLINIDSTPAALNISASQGGAITYTTTQGFGDAQGVPYVSQYIAKRGQDGWANHGISPPQGLSYQEIGKTADVAFRVFTPDLCTAVLQQSTDPPLVPDAPLRFVNLYRRDNCDGDSYGVLTAVEPPNSIPNGYFPEAEGISTDGECAVFHADDQLTPDASPGGSGQQIYESCDGELRLVSVLPSGIAAPDASVGVGALGGGFRSGTKAQAVSNDGSRIYWTDARTDAGKLYVRINAAQDQSAIVGGKCTEEEKACTVKVSQSVSSGRAHFWGAAEDGSKALFTIEDASSALNGNLYEFDLESRKSRLVAGEVRGMVGVGGEGSRVYFVSRKVLSGGNADGETPAAGAPNLYFYEGSEEGQEFSFIATLSSADSEVTTGKVLSPVNRVPYKKTSRVSPDGLHMAFMSDAPLMGYDNKDAASEEPDGEVYTYDASARELSCVSCNPTGRRPNGRRVKVDGFPSIRAAALLPPYQTDLYGSRALSDDGSRLYFNSYEALLPNDTNGKADVYQWERAGAGECEVDSPAYSPPNDGCLALISTGESPTDSEFVDASADGRDVFFTTGSSLLPQDSGLIDIYDAREGGGYPSPPVPVPACEGEACQGSLAQPNDPTPASSAFEGAGNVVEKSKPRKKAKHKKKRRHGKAAKKPSRTAKKNGRSGR